MAKNSSIEWTHHTFNPWWGCTKLSPACDHCYADVWARRTGNHVWGKDAPRRFFGDAHWREPLRWNAEAQDEGVRRRVFCASMADVFDQRTDLNAHRKRLWALIEQTPSLDWLLLTKRPGPALRMVPWTGSWPRNVWFGTTVEDEYWARKRVPYLLRSRAAVRFLSCEPLLSEIDIAEHLGAGDGHINWVIAGGESGGSSRPSDPAWFRSLRDQCTRGGVPFHFKQWGNWRPLADSGSRRRLPMVSVPMERVSKKVAGRRLDARTWDQMPTPAIT